MSRIYVKDFLRSFKRDNMMVLVDVGILRSHKDLSMGMDFIPMLIGQAEYEKIQKTQIKEDIEDVVETSARRITKLHRESILKEIKRL